MKKFFTAFLSLILIISATNISVLAESPSLETLSSASSIFQELQSEEVLHDREEYLDLFSQGKICIDEFGFIVVPNGCEISTSLSQTIYNANQLIRIGLISYNANTQTFDVIDIHSNPNFIITKEDNICFSNDGNNAITPYAEVCSCSYSKFGLGAIVKRNTNDVRGCFLTMAKLNPDKAFTAAVGYWVGKVREDGEWDYKRHPNFAPYDRVFCCTYGLNNSKKSYHLTSEFIGNYNYGYTGSILFNLDILISGSITAAKFDFKKDAADHPAIKEGYADAKSCNEYLDS